MRVHRLEATAFGPFAGTEVVDFDELNDAGVFLLTGQTGAGKTSVLDAISFGLFGAVPGDRNNAKDLRSHHADPRAAPVVELEVTIKGRRFRLRRSPAWSRPSRRAKSGFVELHAQARAAELVDGEWRPLSARVDEVGHLVTRVLGMSRDQFCQVVMLPQGQFQTFLKAGAKERHDVLEALFDTGRFARVEKWLAEHRRARERDCAAHEAGLRELAARIEEVVRGPAAFADPVDAPSEGGESWEQFLADTLVSERETDAALADARAAEAAAHEAAKECRHALDEARSLADRQARHAEATRRLVELDAGAEQVRQRLAQVERAKAARGLAPLVARAREAGAARATARTAVDRALADARGAGVELTEPSLDHTESAASMLADRLRELEALVELERQADHREAEAERLRAEVTAQETALAVVEGELVEAPGLVATARDEHEAARHLANHAAAADESLRRARVAHAAALRSDVLADQIGDAEVALAEARARATAAREAWLDVRERHLRGMAATLAAGLVPGTSCPVCGGVEHPDPAAPQSGHASPDDEAAALDVHTRADEHVGSCREQHERLIAERAALLQHTGGATSEQAEQAVDEAAAAATAAAEAATRLGELGARVEAVTTHLADLRERQAALAASSAAGRALLAERVDQAAAARDRLRAALGDDARAGDEAKATELRVARVRHLLDALRDDVARAGEVAAITRDLGAALAASDFDTADEVVGATMTAPALATAESMIRSARDQRAAVEHIVALPELVDAAEQPEPPLAALAEAADAAALAHREAAGEADRLARRATRLAELARQLADEVEQLAPLAAARDVAARVAAMCAGTSPDNVTRTRLSHYVLGERLQQVVESANLRLRGIAGGRYQLQHSMRRGVGDARGGLGLQVLDMHTGLSRDPATLSGGETFYVSLALALGLADLVRDELGGVELHTLFVDEGFGSLDVETLDEVLDELDSLRAGGRVVGIVSHLPELRQRIPTRLHVLAGPAGSSIVTR